jgi:hypothetical protein
LSSNEKKTQKKKKKTSAELPRRVTNSSILDGVLRGNFGGTV